MLTLSFFFAEATTTLHLPSAICHLSPTPVPSIKLCDRIPLNSLLVTAQIISAITPPWSLQSTIDGYPPKLCSWQSDDRDPSIVNWHRSWQCTIRQIVTESH